MRLVDEQKAALRIALQQQDRAALRCLPKTDLHCHAMLSAPREAYAKSLGRSLPVPPVIFGSFRAFAEYIGMYLLPAMTTPAAVRSLIRAAIERMAADGVI